MINKEDIIYFKHILDSIEDIESSVKGLSKKECQEPPVIDGRHDYTVATASGS